MIAAAASKYTGGVPPISRKEAGKICGKAVATTLNPKLMLGILAYLPLLNRMRDNIITMGVVLVSPIVIFMLLTDLLLGLASRAAPQLNVFALSLSVKNLIFSSLLVLYGTFMIKYMGNDLGLLLRAGSDLEILAKPASP